MIVGDPGVFAIESRITEAYERLSFLALGYFRIHVQGESFGVCEPDATMLGCSYDEVERRIADRGKHVAPFANEDARAIAEAANNEMYADDDLPDYFGLRRAEFGAIMRSGEIWWAPDGDEAFDDSSRVLQFDLGDVVRVIGFRMNWNEDPGTLENLAEASMPAERYYGLLAEWLRLFDAEREGMPKTPVELDGGGG
jgi:hypothetical protein